VKFPRQFYRRFYLYLAVEFSYIFFLSLGVLTFIMVLSRIGKLADLVINKGVELKDIGLLVLYSSPPYLTFTVPMAFLLSIIVMLGRLSTENELLALKASGVNLKCLFVPITTIAVVVAVIGTVNSHLLLPQSGDLFRSTLLNIVKKGIAIEDKEGVFNDSIPGVVIYIDKVDTHNKHLSGILVSDDRDKNIKQTISASTGSINLDSVTLDLYFILEDGNLHRWEKQNNTYRNLYFKNYTFSMNLASMLSPGRDFRKRPYEMDTKELHAAMLKAKEEDKYDYLLEIYKRFSIPLSSLAFIFLAVPLGIRRRVEGRFSGLLYSLLLFIFYYVLIALTENMGKLLHAPVFLTSFSPHIIIILLGFFLLRHLNDEEYLHLSQKIRYWWAYRFEKA
jgi:lipopolysaccharide export system permease protein